MKKQTDEIEELEEKESNSKTIILEKDFRIDSGGSPGRYNLHTKKIINKGKSNEREDWDVVGYGFTMDNLLLKLTHILTDKKFSDPVSLKEYFKEYKNSLDFLKRLITN